MDASLVSQLKANVWRHWYECLQNKTRRSNVGMFCWIKQRWGWMTEVFITKDDSIRFHLPKKYLAYKLKTADNVFFSFIKKAFVFASPETLWWSIVVQPRKPSYLFFGGKKTCMIFFHSVNALKNKTSWIQMWRKYISHQPCNQIYSRTLGKIDFTHVKPVL